MTSRLRKFSLTTHIVSSVGWLGAVVVFLGLSIAGMTSQDPRHRTPRIRAPRVGTTRVPSYALVSMYDNAQLPRHAG